ncbi:MAG: hypothetical protein ACI9TP_000614, partial [Candidatus Azotimanducaceae bacterium]
KPTRNRDEQQHGRQEGGKIKVYVDQQSAHIEKTYVVGK